MKKLSERLKYFINAYTEYTSIRKFEESIGWKNNTVNQMTDNPKVEKLDDLQSFLPSLNINWLLTGSGSMKQISNDAFLSHLPEPEQRTNTNTKDALSALKKIQSRKPNEKSSKIVNDRDLVDAIEIIVPYKGQAGLSSKFYPDEIIDDFEHRNIRVKPEHRGVFYTIEVDGNSMPPEIRPKDWFRCEEISSMYWMEPNFFKKDKIYNIWHNERGIVFKRIIYKDGDIWCSSDNDDKKQYPDFPLDLKMVSKILQVKKLVSRDY